MADGGLKPEPEDEGGSPGDSPSPGGPPSGEPSSPPAHSSSRTPPTAGGSEAAGATPPAPPAEEGKQVERERDEYLELARRTKADFENYRKRVAGESAQADKRARADMARQLLPVLDNLERALSAQADDSSSLAEGVQLVHGELASVLRRCGVESYEPAGEDFDPHWHEAVLARPAEGDDEGRVVEVLEKGYRVDGQVLRPARVVVGSSAEDG